MRKIELKTLKARYGTERTIAFEGAARLQFGNQTVEQPGLIVITPGEELLSEFSYHKIIQDLVSNPVQPEGLEQLRKAVHVLDALDKANGSGSLILEEADWEYLCDSLSKRQYVRHSREQLELIEDVLHASPWKLADKAN